MPLYEYKCDSCGQVFEVIQRFSDAPLTAHKDCGGAVQRLISASALQFKGSGWYVNDYAKSGKGASNAKSAESSGSKSDSGSGGNSGGGGTSESGSSSTASPSSTSSSTSSTSSSDKKS